MRVIVLHDTKDRVSNDWVVAGTVLFDATIIDGGYECYWNGERVEVITDDAAVMLED